MAAHGSENSHFVKWLFTNIAALVLGGSQWESGYELVGSPLETRYTHNMLHFVLSEQQRRQNPFWIQSQPATLALLGKGPNLKFIPKTRSLSMTEVLGACARLNYRIVLPSYHFVRRAEHKWRDFTEWGRDSIMDPSATLTKYWVLQNLCTAVLQMHGLE